MNSDQNTSVWSQTTSIISTQTLFQGIVLAIFVGTVPYVWFVFLSFWQRTHFGVYLRVWVCIECHYITDFKVSSSVWCDLGVEGSDDTTVLLGPS